MLKKTIKYRNFNGVEVEEDFYFNLGKHELMEMQVTTEGGFEEYLRRIIAANDMRSIIREFKQLILLTYGIRTSDNEFTKSDELREKFRNSAAFDQLYFELAVDENAGAEFVNGVLPPGFNEDIEKVAALGNQNVKTVELPQDSQPAWLRENRDPTRKEMESMSKDELAEAFRLKMQKDAG